MGNVSSACEGCFGAQPAPSAVQSSLTNKSPKSKPVGDKPNANDIKSYAARNEGSINTESSLEISKNFHTTAPSYNPLTLRNSMTPPISRAVHKKKRSEPFPTNKKLNMDDFTILKVIGRGAFGKVYLVHEKRNKNRLFALKTLKKQGILEGGFIDKALTEKTVLQNSTHPFVVKLHYSFQTKTTLYLIMDYCPGGELLTWLKNKHKFSEDMTRFYAAEIVLALEYLHEKIGIIYRDLKPENILIDSKGHLKLCDFGLSKFSTTGKSFVGTPEYMAPEILRGEPHTKMVDFWSLGCLLYEMLTGFPPYSVDKRNCLKEDILNVEPVMHNTFSANAKDFIQKLLQKDPNNRVGVNGIDEIKNHPFFTNVNWKDIFQLQVTAPIIPTFTKVDDVSNFSKTVLSEIPVETPAVEPKLLTQPEEQFPDFTYTRKDLMERDRP